MTASIARRFSNTDRCAYTHDEAGLFSTIFLTAVLKRESLDISVKYSLFRVTAIYGEWLSKNALAWRSAGQLSSMTSVCKRRPNSSSRRVKVIDFGGSLVSTVSPRSDASNCGSSSGFGSPELGSKAIHVCCVDRPGCIHAGGAGTFPTPNGSTNSHCRLAARAL